MIDLKQLSSRMKILYGKSISYIKKESTYTYTLCLKWFE